MSFRVEYAVETGGIHHRETGYMRVDQYHVLRRLVKLAVSPDGAARWWI